MNVFPKSIPHKIPVQAKGGKCHSDDFRSWESANNFVSLLPLCALFLAAVNKDDCSLHSALHSFEVNKAFEQL